MKTNTTNETKTSAVLLMTGHSLTLLFNGQPVAGCIADKKSIANLKDYIAARRERIEFSNDNMISFPWLREIMEQAPGNAQEQAIKRLEAQGFKFSNWIAAQPDADGEATGEAQCAVMVRRGATRYGREYREVAPDGSVS